MANIYHKQNLSEVVGEVVGDVVREVVGEVVLLVVGVDVDDVVAVVEFHRDHRGDGVEQLQPFLCDYHGVIVLGTNACEQHYLVLDDCTNDMARPCALDIKLGTRTTEPNASLKKQRKQLAKYPPQTELGCRLVGMRV